MAARQDWKRIDGPQAPIFRSRPELLMQRIPAPAPRRKLSRYARALVTPMGVAAVRKRSLDVIVRRHVSDIGALNLIFDALPMESEGWDFPSAEIVRAGTSADRWPIWRISRG